MLFFTLMKIKQAVKEALKRDELARSNDSVLYLRTLEVLGYKVDMNDVEIKISYADFLKVPILSVTRCRQAIQNKEGLFLPCKSVLDDRELKQDWVKSVFANRDNAIDQYVFIKEGR
jgi:hypothetical protein